MPLSNDIDALYQELNALSMMLAEISEAFSEMVKYGGGGDTSAEVFLQYQQEFNAKIKAVKETIMLKQSQLQDLTQQVVSMAAMSMEEMKKLAKRMMDMSQQEIDDMISKMDPEDRKKMQEMMEEMMESVDEEDEDEDEDDEEDAARSTNPKDFLVVEDKEKPTTWHLQVKRNGKPDHNLMGAAWAALHSGFRGNKYEGPSKQEALRKLKALYKSEGLPLPGE